jgi:hypothetical protein
MHVNLVGLNPAIVVSRRANYDSIVRVRSGRIIRFKLSIGFHGNATLESLSQSFNIEIPGFGRLIHKPRDPVFDYRCMHLVYIYIIQPYRADFYYVYSSHA